MGKTFFTADLHFGHKNILAYDNRQFPNIEEHDAALIERWNDRVSEEDKVWILGDISWYSPEKTVEIFRELHGEKYLCVGNHDKQLLKNQKVRELFCEITDYKELHLDKKFGLVLCHYPIPCFNHHFQSWVHLYGHVHNSFEWNMIRQFQYEMQELYEKPCRMYNVGCMMPFMDYTPKTLEEILFDCEQERGAI